MMNKRSIKYTFWRHYMVLALAACVLIGATLYLYSMHRIRQVVYQMAATELSAVGVYLDGQTELFKDVSTQVATSEKFQRAVRDAGIANSRQTIQSLKQFGSYSPLANSFFLYYRGEPFIWRSTGICTVENYVRRALLLPDSEALRQALETISSISVFPVERRFTLVSVPLRIDQKQGGYDAVFTFQIPQITWQKQIATYAPTLHSHMYVYFGNAPLFGAQDAPALDFVRRDGSVQMKDGWMIVYSPSGQFGLAVELSRIPMLAYTRELGFSNMVIILAVAIVLLMLCYLLANRSSRPIRDLVELHHVQADKDENELEQLKRMLSQATLSEKQLKEHTVKLRQKQILLTRQFFLMLLNGDVVGTPEKRIHELGIRLTGSLFQLLLVRIAQPDDVRHRVEALSDDSLTFLCIAFTEEHEYAIILNTDDESMFAVAEELLQALEESFGMEIQLESRSDVYEGLQALSMALPACKVRNALQSICDAVIKGDLSLALEEYACFCRRIAGYPEAQRRYTFMQVIMRLLDESKATAEIRDKAMLVLSCREEAAVYSGMEALLHDMCLYRRHQNAEETDPVLTIFSYIDANLSDVGLDVSSIAHGVSMSQKQVRDTLTSETGLSPREYFNKRRIEAARKLLENGAMSVADISAAVGYGSVSYFIKNFRQATSLTPTVYRKQYGSAAAADATD